MYFLGLVKAKHGAPNLEKWLQRLLELIVDPRKDDEHHLEYDNKLSDHFMMMMMEANPKFGVPKPFMRVDGTVCAFNQIDSLQLSESAKMLVHGHTLCDIMDPGMEAYELLIISKQILGTKSKVWLAKVENQKLIKVTPAIDGGRGNAATYTDTDIQWFIKTRAIIDQRRVADRQKYRKEQLLLYYHWDDVADAATAIDRGSLFATTAGTAVVATNEATGPTPMVPFQSSDYGVI